jgi:hypothetical protein
MNEFDLPDLAQVAPFSDIKLQVQVIQRLQGAGKAAFGFLGTLGGCPDLSVFPCDTDNDAIGIAQRVLAQHNGFSLVDRHSTILKERNY